MARLKPCPFKSRFRWVPEQFRGLDQRFDIGRKRAQVRLIGGVHAGRGEIFDFAMHEQPQWTAAVRFAQVKFQVVGLGESQERKYFEVAEIAMREQIEKHVVAVFVPRTGGRARVVIVAEHNLERRVRRIAGEILVGINVDIGGMING